MSKVDKIGKFSKKIIDLLNLDIPENTEIYIGNQNREHMEKNILMTIIITIIYFQIL